MEKYAIFLGSGCDQSLLFRMQKMGNLQRWWEMEWEHNTWYAPSAIWLTFVNSCLLSSSETIGQREAR